MALLQTLKSITQSLHLTLDWKIESEPALSPVPWPCVGSCVPAVWLMAIQAAPGPQWGDFQAAFPQAIGRE